jgi:two-component system, OmpR family, response regulator
MKALVFLPRGTLQKRVEHALSGPEIVVEAVVSAKECVEFARLTRYQAILLDADSGILDDVLILIKSLRRENSGASLFVFEHTLDLNQRLSLFDAGADDCIHGPFCGAEFVVRLGNHVRLRQAASTMGRSDEVNILRSGDLEIDLLRRRVIRMGKSIDLRPKEFLLLEYLLRNVNRPVTRTMILENVWKSSFEGLTNVVDVYISALRNKVDREFPQKLIQTNRGIGYTLTSGSTRQTVARAGQPSRQNDFSRV